MARTSKWKIANEFFSQFWQGVTEYSEEEIADGLCDSTPHNFFENWVHESEFPNETFPEMVDFIFNNWIELWSKCLQCSICGEKDYGNENKNCKCHIIGGEK